MSDSNLTVKNLDHLGIVAGLVDELGLVDYLNARIGVDPRETVSIGVVVKAMILNGLGFVSAPLYLFEQFFVGKATEHLLGEGLEAEHFNDDRLGRGLDQLYQAGVSDLFVGLALQARERFKVERRSAHLDATSFAVDGDYASAPEGLVEGAPVPIRVTHGYSRDHRPDLKQFVMNLVCWGDGDIPAFLELADGNQSDKARFADLLLAFKQQWQFEGLYVADSALYSAENLQALRGLQWLTRVPLTLRAATDLVSTLPDAALDVTGMSGYRIATVCNAYGGVRQRWFVVESEARRQADLATLEQTLAKAAAQAQAQVNQLHRQEFACEADALAALERLASRLPWHDLTDCRVNAKAHYDRPGKPTADTPPTRITYHPDAILALKAEKQAQYHRRAGRFILATNVIDAGGLSPIEALQEYKAQQGTERGFRFLKDPLFFASSVFLKSPERIMALAFVMALGLLIYTLGQRQLRQALQQAQQTLPNQLGKATQKPTLRWIFQGFMAVHYVTLNAVHQVVNLTDERRHILQFFGAPCRKYYLLC
jgi:transposase